MELLAETTVVIHLRNTLSMIATTSLTAGCAPAENEADYYVYNRDDQPVVHTIEGAPNPGCFNLTLEARCAAVPEALSESREVQLSTKGGIFLSYRRSETEHVAGRLADHLRKRFGDSRVFIDVDSIGAGVDFADTLQRQVATSAVVLVLIGPRWTTVTDENGRRRLDDPQDFVVLEIGEALRNGIAVVPVLVDEAAMPTTRELPADLAPLVRFNAVRVNAESFGSDTAELVRGLRSFVSPVYMSDVSRRALLVLAGSAALGGGAWAANYFRGRVPEPAWIASTGDKIFSSPTVKDNTLYIGSNDGHLYAFDAGSGQQRWRYPTGGSVTSTPAVAQGLAYVGSNDQRLHAVRIESGQGLWTFDTGGAIHSSPAVAAGVVYVGSRDNRLRAIDAQTGEEQWAFAGDPHEGEVVGFNSSPKVVDGVVYVGCRDHNVYAIRAQDGVQVWRRTTGSTVDSSAAVSGGTLWIGSDDRQLWALDVSTGNPVWLFPAEGGIVSTPAVHDGVIFVGCDDDNLYAVDASTGRRRWAFPTGGYIRSSPAVESGIVYVGSADGSLYAIDSETGEQRWSFATGAAIDDSSPTVVNGVVFFGSLDSKVYALDARRGGRPPAVAISAF